MGSSSSSRPERSQPVTPHIVPPDSRLFELQTPWRNINWGEKAALIQRLEEFSLNHPHVQHMKILLVGEIGAGKSSFINCVKSAFQGRICSGALVDSASASSSRSFTQKLTTHKIRTPNRLLPFVLCDTMGLEPTAGSQTEDIISAIFGHVKNDYRFQQNRPIARDGEHYERTPDLCDQAFCVVYIIAADKVQFMGEQIFEKLRIIRTRISYMGIPQVIVMTNVDEACPLVNRDLKKIYTSRKIKQKMDLCREMLGVPMSYIFPVKNYHEEIDTDDVIDTLILKAVEQIVYLAKDRLMELTDH